jgi:flagellar hook capping protein FlgD
MRKLIAHTLSTVWLVLAATAIAETSTTGGQSIPKIYTANDGPPAQSPVAGATTGSASASSARGHGKIYSPAGALAANPQATGKADVQFDFSQASGATLSGSTRFRFKSGSLDFRSASGDQLVIVGKSATVEGTGTLNGVAGYRFSLSATSGSPHRFRMRITNHATGAVVYDNQRGDSEAAAPTAVLGGGSLEITAASAASRAQVAAGAARASAAEPAAGADLGFVLAQNFPNPFSGGTLVRFTLPERSHLKLMVLDVAGRRVATLAVGAWDPGTHAVIWSGRTDADQPARSGIYFVRMTAGLMSGEQRFMALRKMIRLD